MPRWSRRPPPEPLAYNVGEISALLNLSRGKSYELAKRLGIWCGNRLIVPRAALTAWITAGGDGEPAEKRGGRPQVKKTQPQARAE